MSSSSELSPEIWDHILSFCAEKDDEGLFVSQKTLATCLRVSKTWYLLASPYLYSSPIIRDIHNFFLGSDKPVSQSLSDSLSSSHELYLKVVQEGNTKLPLLHQVQQLRIYPYSLPEDCDFEQLEAISTKQRESYTSANDILSKCVGTITPRVKSISCDSYLVPTGHREREISDTSFKSIRSIKLNLLTHLRPKSWCEFDSPSMSLSDDILKITTTKGLLPEITECHTTLEDPPIIHWGTTNRITVREKEDVRKYLWPIVNNYEGGSSSSSAGRKSSNLDVDWPVDSVSELDQECWIECIYEMVDSSIPAVFIERAEQEEVDSKTIIEVYGIEKFLTISSDLEGVGADLNYVYEDTVINPKIPSDEIDMACLSSIKSSRFTPQELERRRSIYKSIFIHMEERIRELLEINSEGLWTDTLRKAPTIKLYLATDYQGCTSCGQGKGDKWELDLRPRPPPRDDDSDWTDDENDDDDGEDWSDDDGHDFDVDDFIEYDDDDVYGVGYDDEEEDLDVDEDEWVDEDDVI
ncbi:hypothetical protein I302_102596 [Kwoniella bestiolae CBS 10118]|uniref:Uncharacterized protein n=1 Tax=Kwoniella bestiolae CBS 10118 TaxID=1296100 RepID=A0A1B9GFE4_9TREE|nr:hypothetical protein I302_01283 [Kwoniella bestiolae CBS 10118]OCF29770.1 hypothetical protein I302_01283 [Kwoniella bestiolae CBS 10118]